MGEHKLKLKPRLKPQSSPPPGLAIEGDGKDIFIVLDGVRLAKRGRLGTPQAGTWISLEPGWSVVDNVRAGGNELVVRYGGVRVH